MNQRHNKSRTKKEYTKVSQIQFWLTIIFGTSILGIGIYLKLSDQVSGSFFANRAGEIQQGTLTGNSAIFIGVFLLLLGLLFKISDRHEKRKLNNMKKL